MSVVVPEMIDMLAFVPDGGMQMLHDPPLCQQYHTRLAFLDNTIVHALVANQI